MKPIDIILILIIIYLLYSICTVETFRDYPVGWQDYLLFPYNWSYSWFGYPSIFDPKYSVPFYTGNQK